MHAYMHAYIHTYNCTDNLFCCSIKMTWMFVFAGGHVIVQCVRHEESGNVDIQLTIDYLSDAIISEAKISGAPYVSPDSRHIITLDKFSGNVFVQSISEEGTIA